MTALLILGAGGHARVVSDAALASGSFSRIAFLDDAFPAQAPNKVYSPVLGPLSYAFDPMILREYSSAVVAIGDSGIRLTWLSHLAVAGYNLPPVIHPTAWLSPSAQLGPGAVVFAQSAVQSHALIGRGAILNTSCSVDHDTMLGDGVHICPGARLAGEVRIGHRTWIGIGATVIQRIRIGADVTVGAGAAVVRDLPDGVTAVGVPANVLRTA